MAEGQTFIVTGPREWQRAVEAVRKAHPNPQRPWEITIKRYRAHRTNRQNRTMWMWHGEVAAWLSQHTSKLWNSDEVHDWIFKAAFVPQDEVVMPDGEVRFVPRGSSRLSTPEMAEALTAYQAWALGEGIELTEPDDG